MRKTTTTPGPQRKRPAKAEDEPSDARNGASWQRSRLRAQANPWQRSVPWTTNTQRIVCKRRKRRCVRVAPASREMTLGSTPSVTICAMRPFSSLKLFFSLLTYKVLLKLNGRCGESGGCPGKDAYQTVRRAQYIRHALCVVTARHFGWTEGHIAGLVSAAMEGTHASIMR